MAIPKQNATQKRFRTTALLGVMLLVIGSILLNHSISTIQNNQQQLNGAIAPLEQISEYDGSSGWWKSVYTTLFLPLTSVFVALSGIVLFTQPIVTTIQQKKKRKHLSENVKQSSEKHLQPELTNKTSS